jgi:hypothetical protein
VVVDDDISDELRGIIAQAVAGIGVVALGQLAAVAVPALIAASR